MLIVQSKFLMMILILELWLRWAAEFGFSIAVFGCGTVGMSAIMATRIAECSKITGGGANYSIDTSGVADFVRKGLHCLAPRGVEAIVGITPPMEIDMFGELMAEGKCMMGVIEGDAVPQIFIPQMLEYYHQGRFPIDKIMKFYPFEDINQAFEDSHNGVALKAVLRMDMK